MCTMGTVGAITVAVFSTVQFVKLIYHGECLKSAAIQVGKQALFSLSLLAISIAAQGMWGGPAGIIVSIGTGIVIVSYTMLMQYTNAPLLKSVTLKLLKNMDVWRYDT